MHATTNLFLLEEFLSANHRHRTRKNPRAAASLKSMSQQLEVTQLEAKLGSGSTQSGPLLKL
jgi:hypothetical protein